MKTFVFFAVKGDYGEEILPYYRYVVRIEVPKAVRLRRVERRSYEKFGARMLPGGDLYKQETDFFRMAAARTEQEVENWLQLLSSPILRIDGTKPVEENISHIINWIARTEQRMEGI